MSTEATLLDAIAATPEDPAPWLVLADWLQPIDPVHGELIALMAAVEAGPDAPRRIAELKARLGPPCVVGWRNGFADRVSFDQVSPSTVGLLLHSRIGALCRQIRLTFGHGLNQALSELAVTGPHRLLHALWVSGMREADLSALWRSVPHLRFLGVDSTQARFGAIELPELTQLEYRTDGLSRRELRSFTTARWSLRQLSLQIGVRTSCAATDLVELLDGVSLDTLALLGAPWADRLVEVLAELDLHLEVLDLSDGHFTDVGAARLVDLAEHFEHVDQILLERNLISDAGAARLRACFGDRCQVRLQRLFSVFPPSP